jgi:hypothetical protein
MNIIKQINQLLVFFVELGMLVSLGYAGFHMGKSILVKYLLAIVLPLITAVIWGIWEAPRSPYRLYQPFRSLLAMFLFLLAAFLLYTTGKKEIAIIFGITALVTQCLAVVLEPK